MSYFKEVPFKKINRKFSEYKWRVYFYFCLLGRLRSYLHVYVVWPRQYVVLQSLLEQVQIKVSYDMRKSERTEVCRSTGYRGNVRGIRIQWDISYIRVLEHEHMWTRCHYFCLENAECMLQEEGSSHKYTKHGSQEWFPSLVHILSLSFFPFPFQQHNVCS